MYTIDRTTGELTATSPVTETAGTGPYALTVDPTGKFVYVANWTDNTISIYSIDQISGVLTPVGSPIAAGTNPTCVIMTKEIE